MGILPGLLLTATLGVIALFLALPLRVELRADSAGAPRLTAALRPFGRVGPRIALKRRPATREKADKPRAETKRRRGRWQADPVRIGRAALDALADILRAVRIDAADLNLSFGLGDPAETGALYGRMTPLIHAISASPRYRIRVEPVFDHAMLSGRAELDFSFVPARILWPVARFGWVAFGPAR